MKDSKKIVNLEVIFILYYIVYLTIKGTLYIRKGVSLAS